jgi:hypothetical protein
MSQDDLRVAMEIAQRDRNLGNLALRKNEDVSRANLVGRG